MEMFGLRSKIAIVTGGGGYLGQEITIGLAEFGARVVVLDKEKFPSDKFLKRISTNNLKVRFLECDISKKIEVENCMERISMEEKSIDILVNNAYYGYGGDLETISEENWDSGINGTIKNYFICTQSAIKYMKKRGGQIINIASMYGIVSPDPSVYGKSISINPPNYGVGKAAIIQLTKYAAVHLAKYRIRVNSISPGPFPNLKVQKNKQFIKRLAEKVPLKRIGNPAELKGIVVFLASDASSYITGQNISVDGGWTIW